MAWIRVKMIKKGPFKEKNNRNTYVTEMIVTVECANVI